MLLGDRGGVIGNGLPYARQVEYLESTGTQWIDTGIHISSDCKFDVSVAKTRSNYNCVFFGTRNSGTYSSQNSQCYLSSNDTGSLETYKEFWLYSTAIASTANWHSGFYPEIGTMYNLSGISCVSTMQSTVGTMPLFAFRNINNLTNMSCRIGEWKVYTSSVVLRDLIPVIDRNGVACMYDKVSGSLFYNAGTGAFIAGPRKSGGGSL